MTRPSPASATQAPPTAAALMSLPVVTVEGCTPLEQVWHLMQQQGLTRVVVRDAQLVLGIVDATDVWTAWALDLARPGGGPVLRLVTATPCVAAGTPLPQVCSALLLARHETVLVLDEDGSLLGMVTGADVLRTLTPG